MSRSGVALALLSGAVVSGCHDGSYVIGRFLDDGCAEHADALLCSGFEKPDLSDFSRVITVNHAQVEQTRERSFQGNGALHAQSTDQESAAVVAKDFPAVKDGDLYLRAYIYVPDGLETQTMNILFLGDIATPDPFKGTDFNLLDGALQTYSPQDHPDRFTSTALTIPRDKWFCFQVHMVVSKDAGAVTINVDGDVALDEKDMNTRPDAGVHLLRIGIDWSSMQTDPFDYYVDDLVLDTAPIPCEDTS
jgi:hypothetical protein